MSVRGLLTALLLVGCGPAVSSTESDAGGSGGATTGSSSSGRPATTTGATAADGRTTSSTSGAPSTTTAGATVTTGGTTWDTAADTLDFVAPNDWGHGIECSVAAQDCGEGTKCVWYSLDGALRRDASACIPIAGNLAAFEPCLLPNGIGPDITDDCGADAYCLDVYGTADHGYCAPFAVDGCEDYPGTQPVFENGSDFPAACLMHPCHPLQVGACPDGMRCMFYPASLYAQAMCWVDPDPTPQPLGSDCDYGSCGDGQLCLNAEFVPGCETERCCTQWCDFPDGSCDMPEASCEFLGAWGGDETFENVGACVVPGSFD